MPRGQGQRKQKVHTMPPAQEEMAVKTMKTLELPMPIRMPSDAPEQITESASFNNLIHFGAQHADDLKKDIKEQMEETLAKIDEALKKVMSDKTKIVRADIFLKGKENFDEMNSVWEKWIDRKTAPPVSTILVKEFVMDDVLVAVAIVAASTETESNPAETEADAEKTKPSDDEKLSAEDEKPK